MLKILARFWAKRQYVFREHMEGSFNEINAAAAAKRATQKRELAAQLNADSDAIDQNIERLSQMQEKGYWLCENEHETTETSSALNSDRSIPMCSECGKRAKFIKRSEMSGQEQYESDREKNDAEKLAESKRQEAKRLEEEIEGHENTAKSLGTLAAHHHEFAELLKNL